MDYCIVYYSASRGLLSVDELNTILEQSRTNNYAAGITGMMLYSDGSIIQALEGPEEKVKALYEAICRDQRHGFITKVFSQAIEKRAFGYWAMAFNPLTAAQLESLRQTGHDQKNHSEDFRSEHSVALGLIKSFYKTSFRL
ncbi:MAG: BLUF domain-containing protein [Chitinophagaceae bacterium]|nr:MAG: BLUF domain-containing protein [Chitinophagaceae bacterium]